MATNLLGSLPEAIQGGQTKCYAAMLTAVFLWSFSFVGIRYTLHAYHPGSIALLRYLSASVVMLGFYMRKSGQGNNAFKPSLKPHLLGLILAGVLGFGVYTILLNYGEITVNAATANFVTNQIPVLSSVMAIVFLHEVSRAKTWVGFLVSMVGLSLIALSVQQTFCLRTGLTFVIVATVCSSIYTIIQKTLLKSMTPLTFISHAMWFGTIALFIYLPQLRTDLHHANFLPTFVIVMLGIFSTAFSYYLFSYGLSRVPTAKAVSFLYAMPFFTLVLGWFFLGELPKEEALLGGVISLLGTLIVNWRKG
jgi:drug/metabolite transporter (DMT)-like permease